MSNPTKRAAKTLITIWYKRTSGDNIGGYGQQNSTTWEAATALADYKQGGSNNYTVNGVMFTPQSEYWLEVLSENPRLGDYVAIGNHLTNINPNEVEGAEEIRMVSVMPADILHGNQLDDLKIVT